MRDMPGGDMLTGRLDIEHRIIEENVRAEGFEERPLGTTTKEQRLIQTDAPTAQGQDNALVRGRRTRRDQCRTDRRMTDRKRALDAMQGFEKGTKWTDGQRLVDAFGFVAMKRLDALVVRDALGIVTEDDCIPIERDAQLLSRQFRCF